MKLAAERRGQRADEEQLSGHVKAPGDCDWQRDAKGQRTGEFLAKGKSGPECFQLGCSGFFSLGAGTAAGPHRVRSTRINACVTAHGAPRTMNLQRNALKLVAASTKRAK